MLPTPTEDRNIRKLSSRKQVETLPATAKCPACGCEGWLSSMTMSATEAVGEYICQGYNQHSFELETSGVSL